MIGRLPTSLKIDNVDYPIRTDYRDCLVIIQAFNDSDLSDIERATIMLRILYKDNIPSNIQMACERATWFLNGGVEMTVSKSLPKLYDFEQDEQMIFSAINKVAGKEIRGVEYMHFWTFLGLFNEIGEGQFSTIVSIRDKKARHKKLEKWEQEFYRNHRDKIDIKRKYSESEKQDLEELDRFLKGGD